MGTFPSILPEETVKTPPNFTVGNKIIQAGSADPVPIKLK